MESSSPSPEPVYRQRCAEFGAQRDLYQRRSDRNGNVNLAFSLAAIASLGLALWRGQAILFALTGLFTLALIASFVHHDRVNRALRRYSELYKLNREGLSRLQRAWDELPEPGRAGSRELLSPDGHQAWDLSTLDDSTAGDLDLLGHASLEQLLGTPGTPAGQAKLRRWIMRAAPPETVRLRQSAVAELAPRVDFRDEVGLRGRLMGKAQANYERFIEWAEGNPWLTRRPWLIWLARLLSLLALGLIIAQLSGVMVIPALVVVLLVNAVISLTLGRAVGHQIEEVAERQSVFQAYAELFQLISAQPFASPGLRQIQEQLATDHLSAGQQMRRLSRLMPAADLRHWMFFFIIEIPTLWSFHLLWLLERWQRRAGTDVRRWLDASSETEALIALATLHHDHPGWAFPELVEGGRPVLSARNLAHPLLPPAQAVGNDVQVGPPGSFLLVTGSNMSGKSTLLRALGVNTVLAQMGGPVCAAEMRLTPLAVASSMRIRDSLEQGVSTFMAELRRLKAIVDLAGDAEAARTRPLLYLLDEILQGTNTGERQIAARTVILHLVRSGAIGAVSTHDLTLADSPQMTRVSVPVHFSETFTRGPGGPSMSFDYHLRPGIATSTNALKLMEVIGLPLDDEQPG